MPTPTILVGDAIALMRDLPADSVDSIVTDPPYGLGFMGKAWDSLPPGPEFAAEAFRVLKPGGHMLAFGGTRTWHRLAVAVEDAGFEIRDSIAWLYGSGFPKSLDVSKAIDKAAGAEREVVAEGAPFGAGSLRNRSRVEQGYRPTELRPEGGRATLTAPATPDAERWQGWGTALKPAFEPIVVARKPLVGTVAANVLAHGTGALNVDGCRVGETVETWPSSRGPNRGTSMAGGVMANRETGVAPPGRWPPNVVLDPAAAAELDQQSGYMKDGVAVQRNGGGQAIFGGIAGNENGAGSREDAGYGGGGGASRFFYVAKAPKRERPVVDGVAHPTVKPLALMRWLVRLVTPPGGTTLDPFAGSGTTIEAALLEGFDVIGMEREPDYVPLIEARLARVAEQ